MRTNEFFEKLQKYPHLLSKLQGIYSADNLPKVIKKGHFIICNTDIATGEGKHWYCVLKLQNKVLECFDSLGINEEKREFLKTHFCLKNIAKIKYNVTQVQALDSDTCGYYVLYFIVNRYYNQDLSFSHLLNQIFVEKNTINENLVAKFASDQFI